MEPTPPKPMIIIAQVAGSGTAVAPMLLISSESLVENSSTPVYDRYAGGPKAAVGSAAPAPVEPGQQELSLTVDVVWDIAQ